MKAQPLTIFLPDTRGVEVSRYGRGNRKIGMNVFTYSRPAGCATFENPDGTCPGSTPECEDLCYAKRIKGPVRDNYERNRLNDVPPIPAECKLLRLHVSGDFDTRHYINNWIVQLQRRPDVIAWAYTRSWRVPELLPALEVLRALPNMQLFASIDPSMKELPPAGWRRAWLDRSWDKCLSTGREQEDRQKYLFDGSESNSVCITDGTPSYVCPEETGRKPDCESCGYCFRGKRNDVTFLEH
jgi:hypothetical protein